MCASSKLDEGGKEWVYDGKVAWQCCRAKPGWQQDMGQPRACVAAMVWGNAAAESVPPWGDL